MHLALAAVLLYGVAALIMTAGEGLAAVLHLLAIANVAMLLCGVGHNRSSNTRGLLLDGHLFYLCLVASLKPTTAVHAKIGLALQVVDWTAAPEYPSP